MAIEDFTTFIEVDPNSKLAVTASRITGVNVDRDINAYVHDDKGVDHYNPIDINFELRIATAALNQSRGGMGLSNGISTIAGFSSTDISVVFQAGSSGNDFIKLVRGNFVALDATADIANNTIWYCTLLRAEGSDTVTLEIYSDSDRTSLTDTLSVSGYGTGTKYRYLYGFVNHNPGQGGDDWDGYVQNMEDFSPSGTPVSDFQTAYIKGQDNTLDNQIAFLKGVDNALDSQPAYLRGGVNTLESIPAYMVAELGATDSTPTYLAGIDTTLDSQPAYLAGGTPAVDSDVEISGTITGHTSSDVDNGSQAVTISGPNTYLLVVFSIFDTVAADRALTVDFNGTPMTRLDGAVRGSDMEIELWGLTNPDGGTHNVNYTFVDTVDQYQVLAIPLRNVHSINTIDTKVLIGVTSISLELTTDKDRCQIYSFLLNNPFANSQSEDSGQSPIGFSLNTLLELFASEEDEVVTPAGAETSGWSWFGSADGLILNVALSPATPHIQKSYLAGGINVLDGQPAFLDSAGILTDDSQPVYLAGQDTNLDSQPAYLKGTDTDLDAQPAFLIGGVISADAQQAYLKGVDTDLDNQLAFLVGGIVSIDSLPTYLNGQDTGVDSQPAYLVGQDTGLDSIPAYMDAELGETDSTPVYLAGVDTDLDSQTAFLVGSSVFVNAQPAYLVGNVDDLDFQTAYLAGGIIVTNSQDAYTIGIAGAQIGQPAYTKGQDTTLDSNPAYLVGGIDVNSSISAYLDGFPGASSIPAYLEGLTYFPFTEDFTGSDEDPWPLAKWVSEEQ